MLNNSCRIFNKLIYIDIVFLISFDIGFMSISLFLKKQVGSFFDFNINILNIFIH